MAHEAPVEKMIEKVMKKKDLSHAAAVEYMLIVATGRLAALWRYDSSLPEGKHSKGVLSLSGKKKPAERVAPIKPKVEPKPKRPNAKRAAPKLEAVA